MARRILHSDAKLVYSIALLCAIVVLIVEPILITVVFDVRANVSAAASVHFSRESIKLSLTKRRRSAHVTALRSLNGLDREN